MSKALLQLDTEDLQRVLLAHARAETAPSGARERVLAGLSAAVLLTPLASASRTGSGSAAAKFSAWLSAKWLLIGLGSGVLTLSAVEVISRPSAPSSADRERAPSVAATPNPAPRVRAAPLADAEALPRIAATTAPALGTASSSASKAMPFTTDLPESADARGLAESDRQARLPSVVNFRERTVASGTVNDRPPLTLEVNALEAARTALRHDAAGQALQLLNDYAQAFPNGALRVEAAAIYLETIAKQGDFTRALQLAEQFLESNPESPLAGRVRVRAESYRRRVPNR